MNPNSSTLSNNGVRSKMGSSMKLNDSKPLDLTMSQFSILEKVGQGTYGEVFKAIHKKTGRLCALKVVRNGSPEDDEDGLSFTALREVKYLERLFDSENVVTLQNVFFSENAEMVLVFEYMEHDLSGLLTLRPTNFKPAEVKCLLKQLLEGLHQCHAAGIMHRDVKAANLLVHGSSGILKLADFGLATNYHIKNHFSTNVVTLWYRAPELLLGLNEYGPAVDIWSAGCIFIELLTRKSPFPGKNEQHQLEIICRAVGTPTEDTWKGCTRAPQANLLKKIKQYPCNLNSIFKSLDESCLDLLRRMLALDPKKRISASDALDHDFFWTDPMPCDPSHMPKYPAMHEYEARNQLPSNTNINHINHMKHMKLQKSIQKNRKGNPEKIHPTRSQSHRGPLRGTMTNPPINSQRSARGPLMSHRTNRNRKLNPIQRSVSIPPIHTSGGGGGGVKESRKRGREDEREQMLRRIIGDQPRSRPPSDDRDPCSNPSVRPRKHIKKNNMKLSPEPNVPLCTPMELM
jgi:cyclin-dependent kinase 12/13